MLGSPVGSGQLQQQNLLTGWLLPTPHICWLHEKCEEQVQNSDVGQLMSAHGVCVCVAAHFHKLSTVSMCVLHLLTVSGTAVFVVWRRNFFWAFTKSTVVVTFFPQVTRGFCSTTCWSTDIFSDLLSQSWSIINLPCGGVCVQGDDCSISCPSGLYGINCSLSCSCQNEISCSHLDGYCTCREGLFPLTLVQTMGVKPRNLLEDVSEVLQTTNRVHLNLLIMHNIML